MKSEKASPTTEAPLWKIRPDRGLGEEVGFITTTWLNTYYHAPASREIQRNIYYYHEHKLAEYLWEKPNAVRLIAYDPEAPLVYYAYLVGEALDTGPVLHWMFTKSQFRRHGLGTALLEEFEKRCPPGPMFNTRYTIGPDGWLNSSLSKRSEYNPYAQFYDIHKGWHRERSVK